MITIRDYGKDDLDEVVELWYRSWTNAFPHLHHPQPFEDWKLRFQNDLAKSGSIWIAEIQSRKVGFIVIMKAKQSLEQIFVDIDVQGIGIGTALLKQAKKVCPEGLFLTVLQENFPARRFYEKHGFVAKKLGVNPINGQMNIEYVWNPGKRFTRDI